VSEELPPASPEELDRLEALLVDWLEHQVADNPCVPAFERDLDSGERLWMMRVEGEEKPVFTVWFHLRQRTLYAETYLCPAPLEQRERVYEMLLRRNVGLHGVHFAIGAEDAIYLVGRLPVRWIAEPELDWLLGSLYSATEASFRPAMRMGYGDRFHE
jgi:hypothetical protein